MQDTQFVGLDVHKDTIIAVAVARSDRGDVEFLGTIPNTPQAVAKLLRKLGSTEGLHFVYEAVWIWPLPAVDEGRGEVHGRCSIADSPGSRRASQNRSS